MARKVAVWCLLSLSVTGCGTCSTGYRFEVLRPPAVLTPAIVSSGAAPLGIAGIGAGGILQEVAAIGPTAPQQIAARPTLAATATCDLADVCRRLLALEQRMSALPLPARREMLPVPKPSLPLPRGDAAGG